ncbi:hypothetical protein ATANTOWER_018049 [Ataeniobius toweri]|uniref:Uncharacterized protein n=1 Tax=Ataeniobius toweri TaxID=208326 RepID=A0ABU7BCL9_9TELE|nr:hypothetical protein [Ataeniobius toweri]
MKNQNSCEVRRRASLPAAVQLNQGTAAIVACESAVCTFRKIACLWQTQMYRGNSACSKTMNQLTDTPQALLVKPPDEVTTQITPRWLSMAAGLKVVSLSFLLHILGVLGAAQDPDDAHAAQQVRHLPRADPQRVRSLQAWG